MTSLGVRFLNAQHIKSPTISSTAALADKLHKGQKDSPKHDYIHHPARVVRNLLLVKPDADDDMIMAAWLHDTLEDCGIDEDFLRQAGYSERCIAMVKALTRPPDDQREYNQIIDELIAIGNEGALYIKLADNMDNLNPDRVKEFMLREPERSLRFQARYTKSVQKICAVLGLDSDYVLDLARNAPPPGNDAAPYLLDTEPLDNLFS
jgi:(p)ppGpp synthase/HD superfamily hydrolase